VYLSKFPTRNNKDTRQATRYFHKIGTVVVEAI